MSFTRNFRSSKRGIGTIFGMVFFLLIVMIAFASFMIILSQNTGLEQTTMQAKQFDLDRYTELQTTSITNPEMGVLNNAVYISYSVVNNGTLPVQLIRMWVEDVTTKAFANVALNPPVSIHPGSSVYNFTSVPFGSASASDNFIFWFVTTRGNTLSAYPDVNQFNGIQSTGTFPGVNNMNSSYSGNQTPLQLSLNTTQSNQLIYVVVSYDDGNTLYTPTSTPSLTWTLRDQSVATDRYHNPDGDSILKTFYAIMPSPGSITINIRSTADELSDYYCSAVVFAINNVNTTMPFDGSAQTITGQSVTPQNRVTTHYQNELIIGAFGIDAINPIITTGNGFAEIMPVQSSYGASGQPNAMPRSVWTEWAIASNPVNNIPVNCTFTTTRTWAMTLDAVRLYITAPVNPISVSPTSGPMGQKVMVSGQGFQPNSPLIVTVNGTQAIFNYISDQSGNIPSGAFFTVPRGVSPGNNIVVLADNFFNFSSTTFNVIPSSLAISPSSGPLGTSVAVSGLNFAPNSDITVNFDGNALVTSPANLQSNSTGGFSATINTPVASVGIKQISATDGYNSPYSNFTVIPSITLTPSSGTIGSSVTIIGSGFTVLQPVTIKFAALAVPTTPASITADNMGSFSATFNVPTAQVAGAKTVTATDSRSNAANSTFTVNPLISINQTIGNVGTIVSVNGTGFAASSTLSATFNGLRVSLTGTPASANDGTVTSAIFTVPNAPAGNQTLTLTDASSHSGSAGFVVTSTVTLSSASVSAGSSDTVIGTGFAASSIVTIDYGGTTQAFATTSSSGSFSLTFTVPPGLIGAHNVTVSDGRNIAYATYNLTQSVILNPSSGPAGSFVTVSGFGFTPSSTINVTFAGTTIATIPSNIIANNQGTFSATFTVPTGTIAGDKLIQAIDSSSMSASANFTVVPTITLSPTSGSVGTTVTVSGTGYSSQSFITLKFAGATQPIGQVKTSKLGAFTCTFTVPAAVADLNTVTAADAISNTGAAAFLVIPTITLNPTSGNIGSTVTVSGTGFSGSQSITATFNGIPVTLSGNTSTSSSGSFTGATFTVPVSPSGAQTVIIRDSSLYFDDSSFTINQVVQPITITMSNSAPSATLTINSSYASPTTLAADGSPHSITMPAGLQFNLSFANAGSTRNGFAISGSFSSSSSVYTGSTTPITATAYEQVQNTYSVTINNGNPTAGDTLALSGTYLGSASNILTLNVGGTSSASSTAWSDYNAPAIFSATTTLSSSTERWAINGAYSTIALMSGGNTYSQTYYHQYSQTLSYSITYGGSPTAPTLTSTQFGTAYSPALTGSATSYWLDNGVSWSVTNPLVSGSERWITGQTVSGTASASQNTNFIYYNQYKQTLSYQIVNGGSPTAPTATGTSLGSAYAPSLTTSATAYWFDATGSIAISTPTGTNEQWAPNPASISATSAHTQVISMYNQYKQTLSYQIVNGGSPTAPTATGTSLGSAYAPSLTTSATAYWFDATGSIAISTPTGTNEQWAPNPASISATSAHTQVISMYNQYKQTLSYQIVNGGSPTAPTATGTSLGSAYAPSLTTSATAYWFDATGSIAISTPTGTNEQWAPNPASISATSAHTQVISMYNQYKQTLSYQIVNGGSPTAPTATGTSLGSAYAPSLTTSATAYWFDATGSIAISTPTGTNEQWAPNPASISATSAHTQVISMYNQYKQTLSYQIVNGGSPTAPTATGTSLGSAYAPSLTTSATAYWFDATGSIAISTPTGTNEQWAPNPASISATSAHTQVISMYNQYKQTLSYQIVNGGSPTAPTATGTSLGSAYAPSLTTSATAYWFDATGSIAISTPTGTNEQWAPNPASISATSAHTQVISMYNQYKQTLSYQIVNGGSPTAPTATGTSLGSAYAPSLTTSATAYWFDATGSIAISTPTGTNEQWAPNPASISATSAHTQVISMYNQYQVSFTQTGIDISAGSNTVLTVASTNYAYNALPASTWYDSGTTFSWASTVAAGTGKQFAITSTSGSSPITAGGTYTATYHTVAILSVGTDTEAQGTSLTMSWSHTLISGSNRMIVVYLGVEHNGASVSGVTYGGRTMTLATSNEVTSLGTYMLGQIWYILEANLPANGAQTVAVTMTGSNSGLEVDARCAEYTGVKQNAPEATNGASQLSGNTITNTISPSTNSWVLSVSGSGNTGTWTEQSPQTQLSQYSGGTSSYSFAELQGASGQTSLASTYSGTVNRLVRACASFQPAP